MHCVNFFCLFVVDSNKNHLNPFIFTDVLLGGQAGAVRYSVIFAAVGAAVDYVTPKIKPFISKFAEEKDEWLKLPEWSPIKVLDEEAVAAKRAREEQIYRNVHNLNKEES